MSRAGQTKTMNASEERQMLRASVRDLLDANSTLLKEAGELRDSLAEASGRAERWETDAMAKAEIIVAKDADIALKEGTIAARDDTISSLNENLSTLKRTAAESDASYKNTISTLQRERDELVRKINLELAQVRAERDVALKYQTKFSHILDLVSQSVALYTSEDQAHSASHSLPAVNPLSPAPTEESASPLPNGGDADEEGNDVKTTKAWTDYEGHVDRGE